MQAALALLPLILQYLPTVTVGIEHLIAWISGVRTAAKQSGEWTPEMETDFLEALIATKNDPAYQPDRGSPPVP